MFLFSPQLILSLNIYQIYCIPELSINFIDYHVFLYMLASIGMWDNLYLVASLHYHCCNPSFIYDFLRYIYMYVCVRARLVKMFLNASLSAGVTVCVRGEKAPLQLLKCTQHTLLLLPCERPERDQGWLQG